MSFKTIKVLQKIFQFVGWSILILALMRMLYEAYTFFFASEELHSLSPQVEFSFLSSFSDLFSYLAQAYFAFLVSSVFAMVFNRGVHREPAGLARAQRFLVLTCGAFVIDGLLALVSWLQAGVYFVNHIQFSWMGLLSVGAFLLGAAQGAILFVYAISIYVLFRHFVSLVQFEAEVV